MTDDCFHDLTVLDRAHARQMRVLAWLVKRMEECSAESNALRAKDDPLRALYPAGMAAAFSEAICAAPWLDDAPAPLTDAEVKEEVERG